MNTFTDAQLIVSRDAVELLDCVEKLRTGHSHHGARAAPAAGRERLRRDRPRPPSARTLKTFFREVREGTDTLKVTVLTTLQCNFACDYCIQGDHGDYNKTAAKMSMEMADRLATWMESRLDAITPKRLTSSRSSAASRR